MLLLTARSGRADEGWLALLWAAPCHDVLDRGALPTDRSARRGALTAMVGVGKTSCHARAGAGAVSTQASPTPYHAYDGLGLMAAGRPAQEALGTVLAVGPGVDFRQVGFIDHHGRAAARTGGRVRVYGAEAHPLWDLRAGRADDPAAELCRLHDELGAALRPAIAALPTRDDPLGEMVRRQMS